jgi:hypothetical protein
MNGGIIVQNVKQDLFFSSIVSDNTDVDDFIIEFISPEESSNHSPIKITRNFDELLEFLDEFDDH